MSRPRGKHGDRFATLIDVDGRPPCSAPDDCDVCRLFLPRRPDETLSEWARRAVFPPYRRTS